MLSAVFTAIGAFISTNIDDIFLLMFYFARIETRREKAQIIAGQYLGTGALYSVSLLAAFVLHAVPQTYIGLLGLIPIALGIRKWIAYRREKGEDVSSVENASLKMTGVMLITIANGGDNLGVYIPLFASCSAGQLLMILAVFLLMVALWCYLGQKLVDLPVLRAVIQTYQHILVPGVLTGLGIYIFLGSRGI